MGPLFTYLRVPDSIPINAQNQAEIGGRFSWNFSRHVALDTETEASPFRTTNLTTSYQGGYLLQTFAGIKAGNVLDNLCNQHHAKPRFAFHHSSVRSAACSNINLGRVTTLQAACYSFRTRFAFWRGTGLNLTHTFGASIQLRPDQLDLVTASSTTSAMDSTCM